MKTSSFYFFLVSFLAPLGTVSGQNAALADSKNAPVPPMQQTSRRAQFEQFDTYLAQNLTYPEVARKNGVEGEVVVEITIDTTGEIESVGLVKGIGFGCDEALMALVSNMPAWTPGQENGAVVAQKVLIRALFRLQ
jgi:TonB family protein